MCEPLQWEFYKHLTENVREQINIPTESHTVSRRKWKKISYYLSLPLSESGKLAFTHFMEKEHCLLPPMLIADMVTNKKSSRTFPLS